MQILIKDPDMNPDMEFEINVRIKLEVYLIDIITDMSDKF